MDNQDCQTVLTAPQLRLLGSVDEAMYAEFRNQLSAAPKDGPLVIALTTLGGNPEIARAMADDVRLLREAGRTIYFLGKAAVYSAGATFMAGFPVECRFLTRDTTLLVHERQIAKTINLSGPLRSCISQLKAPQPSSPTPRLWLGSRRRARRATSRRRTPSASSSGKSSTHRSESTRVRSAQAACARRCAKVAAVSSTSRSLTTPRS